MSDQPKPNEPIEPEVTKPTASGDVIQKSDEENLKKTALYTALYSAYFGTIFEADKSILTISAGGVGLLVTLMAAFDLKSVWHIIYYLIALTLFVISIISCIFIFKRNRIVLHSMLMKKSEKDSLLTFLDYLSISCCILGIIATIAIGVASGIQKINKKPVKDIETAPKSLQVGTVNGNVIIQQFSNVSSNNRGRTYVK
jgi:hypothetical protein